MNLDSMRDILNAMEAEGREFWEVVLETDMENRQVTREQSMEKMSAVWHAMLDASDSYTGERRSLSGLVGGQGALMRRYAAKGDTIGGDFISQVISEALAMGECNAQYMLSGVIELGDAFFGGSHAGGRRGRGTDKTPVIFAVSLDENGSPRYVRAQVVTAVNGENLARFAKEHVKPGSVIHSDGLAAYGRLGSEGYSLQAENFDLEKSPEHLKWLHIIVSNAKAFILGTFHGLHNTHLQAYFDEFCYRVNRRWQPERLFSRSVLAAVSAPPFTRYVLIG